MRRIAVINQKGGVGKTTTCANLGAALAQLGRRVVLIDMDAQANLSMHLGLEVGEEELSSYSVLLGKTSLARAMRPTKTPKLFLVPSHLELSGAELELASTFGRETLLRIAIEDWEREERSRTGSAPADYLIFDCPPSLGLLSINALAAASEILIALQTEFFALQGMSTLVDVVSLLKRRLHPTLEITGILPCLYDNRKRLAREVLAEIRAYFPGKVFRTAIRANVKLAEAPSFAQTIFEYAPESNGALDYMRVAEEVLEGEARDAELAAKPRVAWSPITHVDAVEQATPIVAESAPSASVACAAPAPAPVEVPSTLDVPPLGEIECGVRPTTVPLEGAGQPNLCGVYAPKSDLRIPTLAGAQSEDPPHVPSRALHASAACADPVAIEDRIEGWVREERAGAAPELASMDPPRASQSVRVARERTYLLYPTAPPRAQPAGGVGAGLGPDPGVPPARPNDLLTLCLRSLRSLWRA